MFVSRITGIAKLYGRAAPDLDGGGRTVARKFSVGGLCVSAAGLDILKADKNYTNL